MPKVIPFLLWGLVLLMGIGLFLYKYNAQSRSPVINLDGESQVESIGGNAQPIDSVDGRTIVKRNWNDLPHVDRFVLTDQQGQPFDSAELHGRPYVVSFFFATCPSFCRDLNNELHRVNQILSATDVQFLTLTVDPENDTTEVLKKYASGYDAKPERWAFLNGKMSDLVRVGQRMFNVVVDRDTHTDNILLVDKWGRYRDRFKWNEPQDMKRFVEVVREVAAETEPPLNQTLSTRNANAGVEPVNLGTIPWLRDFHVTSESENEFFSRKLTGQVWLANFSQHGTGNALISPDWIDSLRERSGAKLTLINLYSHPDVTTHPKPTEAWQRYTAEPRKFIRIGRECFGLDFLTTTEGQVGVNPQAIQALSNTVFVIDRWSLVRGRLDLSEPGQQEKLEQLISQLKEEAIPPTPTFGFSQDQL